MIVSDFKSVCSRPRPNDRVCRAVASMSSASEQLELEVKLRLLDEQIKDKIVPDDPTVHRQFKSEKNKNPVASLEIPNSMYYKWDEKINIQRKLGRPVPNYADLLNFSLCQSSLFASVNRTIEGRLKKLASSVKYDYRDLFGSKKSKFKRLSRKLLLFKTEVEMEQCPIEIPGRLGWTLAY